MTLGSNFEQQPLLLDDDGSGFECCDGGAVLPRDEAILWKALAVMYNFFATGIFQSAIGVS